VRKHLKMKELPPSGDDPASFHDGAEKWRGRPALTAKEPLAVFKMVPDFVLNGRHNYAPPLRVFVKIARAYPGCRFTGYAVGKRRADERVSIDGIRIPRKYRDLAAERRVRTR